MEGGNACSIDCGRMPDAGSRRRHEMVSRRPVGRVEIDGYMAISHEIHSDFAIATAAQPQSKRTAGGRSERQTDPSARQAG